MHFKERQLRGSPAPCSARQHVPGICAVGCCSTATPIARLLRATHMQRQWGGFHCGGGAVDTSRFLWGLAVASTAAMDEPSLVLANQPSRDIGAGAGFVVHAPVVLGGPPIFPCEIAAVNLGLSLK